MKIEELFSVRGKVAVVTGGSRGLGEMIARQMGKTLVAPLVTLEPGNAGDDVTIGRAGPMISQATYRAVLYDMGNYLRSMGFKEIYYMGDSGGNGRGMQAAIAKNPDMELVGVYTRRDPQDLQLASPAPRFAINELQQHTDQIDVLILCGGSKSDLPEQGPKYAALYNTVDSFDPHARIPEYFETVDAPAKGAGKTALISAGWDPGMFSINRVYGEALAGHLCRCTGYRNITAAAHRALGCASETTPEAGDDHAHEGVAR